MIITNLLTNMVIVSLSGFLSKELSHKPAFQDYAECAMFEQASNLIVAWNLSLPRPVTTNMITQSAAAAYVEGIEGFLTFSNRYVFDWKHDRLMGFQDTPNIQQRAKTWSVNTNDAIFEQWMRATNLLTTNKACIIAEAVMKSIGVPIKNGKFKKPGAMNQMSYEWKDGIKYPMPFYRFRWDYNGFDDNYEIHVSGITSNVIQCFFVRSPYLKPLKLTNYYELFGFPKNPIFVYCREQPLFLPQASHPTNASPVKWTYELHPLQK